jgi:hypothetical protein
VLFYVLFVLCRSVYCLCVYMCTVVLPSGGYPIAVEQIYYNEFLCFSFSYDTDCTGFLRSALENIQFYHHHSVSAEILGSEQVR